MSADRTVKVNLVAQVAGFISGVRQAGAAVKDLSKASIEAKAQIAKHGQEMTKVGTAFLAGGAVAAAGLALVVKATADYGAKMAQLQSLSHASAGEMKQLSDAAMTVGQAYGFSATQVADAEIELTKAGIGVKEQLGGALQGALTLAAAGQLDVAQATEITTVAMTQFSLSAKDVPHVADLLAAGADKALGSVGDLGEALKNGGLQAHNMGLTIDDTVGLLSAFANAGIIGAEAGTQMRSMFIQLQKPTAQSQAVLDKYGISLNDASGKFVGITKLGEELRQKLGGLTQAQRNQALATVFGSHAITGATVLYNDSGKAAEKAGLSIADWIKNVNDSGFASAQAAGKMNSLQGDVQKLSAAFQTDLIKAGSGANDSLRGITQGATSLLNVFGGLPGPMQGVILDLGLATAAIGLLGGTALITVPKIVEMKAALTTLGTSAGGLAARFGPALLAVTALTVLMANAGTQGIATADQIKASAKSMGDSFKNVNSLFAGNFFVGKGIKNAFDQENSGEAADNKALGPVGDVYRSHEGAFSAIGSQLAGLSKVDYSQSAKQFNNIVKQVGAKGDTDKIQHLIKLLGPDFQGQLSATAKSIHVTASAQNLLAIASGKGAVGAKALAAAEAAAAGPAKVEAQAEKGLASAIKQTYDARLKAAKQAEDTIGTDLAAKDAIQATADQLKSSSGAWGANTSAGRKNEEQVLSSAQAIQAHAAVINADGKHALQAAQYTDTMGVSLVNTMVKFGVSRKAAEAYVGKLLGIPKGVTTEVQLKKDNAEAKLKAIRDAMNNLNGMVADIYVNAVAHGVSASRAGQIARNALQADGGLWDGGRQLATTHAANGLVRDSMIAAGGANITWAEPETGWEAYISGKSGASARNKAIWAEAGRRLGTLQSAGSSPKTYSGAGSSYGGVSVQMPDTITVQDASGFTATMKVVADRTVSQYHLNQHRRMPRA